MRAFTAVLPATRLSDRPQERDARRDGIAELLLCHVDDARVVNAHRVTAVASSRA